MSIVNGTICACQKLRPPCVRCGYGVASRACLDVHFWMFKTILYALASACRSRRQLALENVALRHQLDVLQRNTKRPRLKPSDRALSAVLSRILPDWMRHLTIVQPDCRVDELTINPGISI